MRKPFLFLFAFATAVARWSESPACGANSYPWLESDDKIGVASIAARIAPPPGFVRVEVASGSFGDWLRHLPLKDAGTPVLLHDGRKKGDQSVHHAVIDIDTGSRDLQQCADAIMRLRGEYLYSRGEYDSVRFSITSRHAAILSKWQAGYRPSIHGESVTWSKSARPEVSHGSFRRFMDVVFAYAGTESLSDDMRAKNVKDLEIGDVFIRGGSPGHAVIVVDMARNPQTGEKRFLLAQSYMPAQDVHVLKNPVDRSLSPWYRIPGGAELVTPEWTFLKTELKCFAPERRSQSPGSRAVETTPASRH